MRRIITLLTFGFVGLTSALQLTAMPTEVSAPVERLFIPHGFDDNDLTEVIVHGNFSDTCYRVGNSGYDVDQENHLISVWVTAFRYEGEVCAQVLAPYIKSIKVGILEKGQYDVKVVDAPHVKATFAVIERTTESPDDFLYAPVFGANIAIDAITGRQSLNLIGTYPHTFWGCMVIKEVRMDVANDVMVVRPIMETLHGAACEGYQHDFDLTFGLSEPLGSGETLLHVRVLNGTSYNRLLEFE